MATRLLGCARLTIVENVLFNTQNNIKRHGHRMRGKAPDVARTLEQRLNGNTMFSNILSHLVKYTLYIYRNDKARWSCVI